MIKFLIIFLFLFTNLIKAENNIDLIIVNKKKRNMMLHSDGKIVETYNISLGFEPVGKKIKRGDGKTPEGLYFIENKIRESAFFLAFRQRQ